MRRVACLLVVGHALGAAPPTPHAQSPLGCATRGGDPVLGFGDGAARSARWPRRRSGRAAALRLRGGGDEPTLAAVAEAVERAADAVGDWAVADADAVADAAAAAVTAVAGASSGGLKVVLVAALCAFNVACWYVPFRTPSFVANEQLLSYANAFSGGVFLALAFGHLMPHAVELLSAPLGDAAASAGGCPPAHDHGGGALAHILVLVGYLMILAVEKLFVPPGLESHGGADHGHGGGGDAGSGGAGLAVAPPLAATLPLAPSPVDPAEAVPPALSAEDAAAAAAATEEVIDAARATSSAASTALGLGPHGGDSPAPTAYHAHHDGGSGARAAIMLLAALSVHSMIEIMALALTRGRAAAAVLAASIAIHQPAESLALLVALLRARLPRPRIFKLLCVFSCVGPIGAVIGFAAQRHANRRLEGIMLALTAGTFVYVGATEVVGEEFETEHAPTRLRRAASLVGGVALILTITHYAEHMEGVADALGSNA